MCNGRNTGVQIARYAMCGKCKITLQEVGGSVYKKKIKNNDKSINFDNTRKCNVNYSIKLN